MENVNRQKLAKLLLEKNRALTSQANAVKTIDAFIEVVTNTLKSGGTISLQGFGTFKTVNRAARIGRNPLTGEKVSIPAKRVPKLAFSKGFIV